MVRRGIDSLADREWLCVMWLMAGATNRTSQIGFLYAYAGSRLPSLEAFRNVARS